MHGACWRRRMLVCACNAAAREQRCRCSCKLSIARRGSNTGISTALLFVPHHAVACSHWLGCWALAATLVPGAWVLARGVDVRRHSQPRSWRPNAPAWTEGVGFAAHGSTAGVSPSASVSSSGGGGGGRARRASSYTGGPRPRGAGIAPAVPLDPDAWRAHVGSAAVAAAWERLSGAVVQEFVYDAFYAYVSPDRDFPAAVRGLLNAAFGEAARRARSPRIDWGKVLVGCVLLPGQGAVVGCLTGARAVMAFQG
jgi:hypothetical protein